MDAAGREEFLGRVRDLLASHPDTRGHRHLELPHLTAAYRLTPR
jgi:hypothetical protein